MLHQLLVGSDVGKILHAAESLRCQEITPFNTDGHWLLYLPQCVTLKLRIFPHNLRVQYKCYTKQPLTSTAVTSWFF